MSNDKCQIKLANVIIDDVTLDESLQLLQSFIESKSPKLIVTPNPEMIVSAQNDPLLMDIINHADMRLPDGISMVVVSKIKGTPLRERVTGIDFLLAACELAAKKGWRIYLIGSAPGVVEKAAKNLVKKYPGLQVVGTSDGYFKDDDLIVTKIRESKADIIFAGLGAGRQERFLKGLGIGVGVGIGGSFDVISGVKKRAPKWIQKLYIEWLYRLITEPQRWKRQLALPKFLWITLIKN